MLIIKRQTVIFLYTIITGLLSVTAVADSQQTVIKSRIDQLQTEGRLEIHGVVLNSSNLMPAFYQARSYEPAWPQHPGNADQLLARLQASSNEGLEPDDYYVGTLARLLEWRDRGDMSPGDLVDLDLLLTEALVRYAYHLRFGKVNPQRLDKDWNYQRSLEDAQIVEELEAAIASPSLGDVLTGLAPPFPLYRNLQDGLEHYRAIEAAGGWEPVGAGPTLKPDMRDPRVERLRARLQATEDLPPGTAEDPQLFDEDLKAGVIHFQERYGLDADGLVGKSTLAALDVPVHDRINQIRVNLDRARWVANNIPDTFIIVDIAGYRARLFRNGEIIWDEPAQVGKPYRKTPIFREDMTYMQVNPTWTVPPTILRRDILPKVRENPDYLREKNIRVLTHDGTPVDPDTIDWPNQKARGFRYLLRQDPGPANALGRIKFMFPNPHFVYLHDTPHRELFDKTSRAFSSGCVRVRNPYRLAELLLDDPEWTQEKIETAIDSNKTRNINLANSVPVLLLYWTVDAEPDGTVHFKEDIYDRDSAVLARLQQPFEFDAPEWAAPETEAAVSTQ